MTLDRIFETAERRMDDAIEYMLGDVIEVSNNGGAWTERKCTVLDEHQILNLMAIDANLMRVRVKINRDYVGNPSQARFRGGKLGDRIWKPGGDATHHAGRYWVFDVQMASN